MNSQVLEVLQNLGVTYSKIEQIVHEESLSSLVFRIWTQQGKSRILKLSHNADRYRREVYHLSHLHKVIPVPEIIDVLPPKEEFSGAILMEDIKGDLLNGATLTDQWAFMLGEILGKLHTIKAHSYGDVSLKEEKRTPREEMQKYFDRSYSESEPIVDPILLNQCKLFVDTHISVLKNVDGPFIVHRDYRPGNAIAREGEIQAIIDFEIAMGSFAEEDFMQMDMLVWPFFPQTRASFMKGYSQIRPLPHLDEVLPLLRILKAVGAIGFTYERGTWQTKHKHVFLQNLNFLKIFFHFE